jgi:hypothetical protein
MVGLANTNKTLARSLIVVWLMTGESSNFFEEKKDLSCKKRVGLDNYGTISTLDVVAASSNKIPKIMAQKNLSKTSQGHLEEAKTSKVSLSVN